MHLWIVLAAFAFAAATPFMSVPGRSDAAQLDEADEAEPAVAEKDGPGDA